MGRNSVLRLDREDRIEIVPDWERVHDMLYTNPEVRERWSWLVLPIRWGYPAAESPFAGVISHASTGNLAPQTGSQNKGWNRAGAGSGFREYDPHRYSGFFALGWQDGFRNTWGWLNVTVPTIAILPPVDLVVKLIGTPLALLTDQGHTYLQADEVPFRFVAIEGGAVGQDLPDGFLSLLLNRDQIGEIVEALGYAPGDEIPSVSSSIEQPVSPYGRISFMVGRRFASENAFWMTRAGMQVEVLDANQERVNVTSDLRMWEWAGSMRLNLGLGGFQPYAKLGYGVTWFRLENTAVGGEPVSQPQTETVHPFTWHWGLGIEWMPISSFAPPPRGMDVGIRLEFAQNKHSLGLDQLADPLTLALGDTNRATSVSRSIVQLAITLGF